MSLIENAEIQKWCKSKQVFSKKINGGYYTPTGDFIFVPSGIMRSGSGNSHKDEMGLMHTSGWRVEFTNKEGKKESHYVSDKQNNGCFIESLRKSIKIISSSKDGVILKSGNKINNREKSNKKDKLGIPGICISKHTDQRNGTVSYRFMISIANKKKTVTIGHTLDKDSSMYKIAFEKAVSKRQALLEKHNEENEFNGVKYG